MERQEHSYIFGNQTKVPKEEVLVKYWKEMQGENGHFLLVKPISANKGIMTLITRDDRAPVCRDLSKYVLQKEVQTYYRMNRRTQGSGCLTFHSRLYFNQCGIHLPDLPDFSYGFTPVADARDLELGTMLYNHSSQLKQILTQYIQENDPDEQILVYLSGFPYEFGTGLVFIFFLAPIID